MSVIIPGTQSAESQPAGTQPTNSQKAIADIYPLSPTQQGMLFHSLYGPQSGVYAIQVGFTLEGRLNAPALEAAWQQLIARHTVLRTAFVWNNLAEPLQVVGHQARLPLARLDWQAVSPAEQAQQLSTWLEQDRRQGFDLATAPLMRLTLIQLEPDCYRMQWSYHHLLLDGWSVPLLLKELLVSYQAIALGQTPPLPQPLPYRDYIAWLKQQDWNQAQQFWQEQLQGITAPTPLSIGHAASFRNPESTESKPEEPLLTPMQGEAQQLLSAELTQQLQQFAQSHRLTPNTLIQGAWAYVLGRYSGESEVLFGAACAGRPVDLPGAEQRVGLFINTLPRRISVASNQALLPWLQQIQAQQQAQQPYEYSPLVKVQSCSDVPRSLPLFESIVVYENYPVAPALKQTNQQQNSQALKISQVTTAEQTNYPLSLFAAMTGETTVPQLSLKLLYEQARFSAPAMVRLLAHLETVLSAMVGSSADPAGSIAEQTLGQLPLLSALEQQQFEAWNPTQTETVLGCLPQQFEQQASTTPERIALRFEQQSLSYRDLNARVNQLAHYLKDQGIQPGCCVGLCLPRSPELVISLLAILKAGGTYLPLDPNNVPGDRLYQILQDAQVEFFLTSNPGHQLLADLEKTTVQHLDLAIAQAQIEQQSQQNPQPQSQLDDSAYILYTSGSTGKPKGVPISHRSLSNLLNAMAQATGIASTDRLLAVTTVAFDIAMLELFLPLITGAELIVAAEETARNPEALAAAISDYGVTVMQATPATWRLLIAQGWQGSPDLKILCGGEALEASLAQPLLKLGRAVWNLYGPTETTIWSGAVQLCPEQLEQGIVPIGGAIANTQFHVLDEQQRLVPISVAGELHIGGLGLSTGYLNRPDLTQQQFIHLPGVGRLYKTGDRVRWQEDGTLEYLGRLDYQVKLRGYRIELGEIEAALSRLAGVTKAIAVVEQKDPKQSELVAYFTGQTADAEQLRQAIADQLPSYMIPQAFIHLESFPLTANGKINRKALSKALGRRLDPQAQASIQPESEIEKKIHQIWQELLELDNIGLYDNFFDAGGHSLLMVHLQSQLKAKLSTDLSLVELFRYPTIHAIARQIKGQQATASSPGLDRNQQLKAGKQRLQQRRRQRQASASPPQAAPPPTRSGQTPEPAEDISQPQRNETQSNATKLSKTRPEVTPHG